MEHNDEMTRAGRARMDKYGSTLTPANVRLVCDRIADYPEIIEAVRRMGVTDPDNLPWADWPWQACRARREPREGMPFGRCELRKGHEGDHALERGFDTPRWSTEWTA